MPHFFVSNNLMAHGTPYTIKMQGETPLDKIDISVLCAFVYHPFYLVDLEGDNSGNKRYRFTKGQRYDVARS